MITFDFDIENEILIYLSPQTSVVMINKAVITAAGLGTRMRNMTLIMPKALLPLIRRNEMPMLIPIIDLIMAKLQEVGVSKFIIVVGRNGKPLIDYLMDKLFTDSLKVRISFTFQEKPLGFGDAVLRAEDFVNNEPFFVHADDGILTNGYLEGVKLYDELRPDAILFLRKVRNPSRYGIAVVKSEGIYNGYGLVRVLNVEEKPGSPKSDIAISAVYIFNKRIFEGLRSARANGELELTYGIANVINSGGEVYGLLFNNDPWLSVGDPESYFNTINRTFNPHEED